MTVTLTINQPISIRSDRYIDIIMKVVHERLPAVWLHPSEVAWLNDPTVPVGPISQGFADRELTVPVDLRTPCARMVFNASEVDPIVIVASLAVLDQPSDMTVLIRDDLSLIFLIHTTVQDRPDGVLQLFGGEAGIVLLTPEQLRAQLGRQKLLRGTGARTFRVGTHDEVGNWISSPVTLPSSLVKSISVE